MRRADAYVICKEVCRAAGSHPNTIATDIILAAVGNAVEAERERCAKIAENCDPAYKLTGQTIADAIRDQL